MLTPLRTLVIEDCQDDHDLLLLKLRQAGFEPSALRVESIAEIEAALALNEWQMVFSDFDLPGFDGLRALKLVRAVDTEIPFFIVSGVMDEEQAVAAMRAGAQDYFFKGKLARLGPAVGRELHEAEQRRQRREAKVDLDRDRNVLRSDRIRFVDVMSHEMRTPLNIINVAAGMLERYGERMGLNGRQERLTEIQDAVARMTRVIDKVLLMSRLELRRWDLKSETFDPAVWCEEFLMQDFGDPGQRDRIKVHAVDLPAKVAMDQRVIEIALQNLLSNALKYSLPDSLVELELRADCFGPCRILRARPRHRHTRSGHAPHIHIVLSCKQCWGCGWNRPGSRNCEGLCGRAWRHPQNGEQPGGRDVHQNVFPRLAPATECAGRGRHLTGGGDTRMTRVLIIEDDAVQRRQLAELFRLEDFEVAEASSGQAGIAAVTIAVPDLVVCDIMMPGTDGFGVLEALRKHRDTALTPFIFLTAKAGGQDVRLGMGQGADDYVTKPFDPGALIASARQRLARRRLQIDEAQRRAADTGMLAAAALPREMEGCLAHIETIVEVFTVRHAGDDQSGQMRRALREELARLRMLSQRLKLYGELPSLYARRFSIAVIPVAVVPANL